MDGETVDYGLIDFQGSFKKQIKFKTFMNDLKEPVITLTLEPVPPEEWKQPGCSATLR